MILFCYLIAGLVTSLSILIYGLTRYGAPKGKEVHWCYLCLFLTVFLWPLVLIVVVAGRMEGEL